MNRKFLLALAIFSFFGLFALLMAWNTVLAPSTRFPVALVLLVSITPLLLPFRGLLDGRLKSCTWLSYLSLFYFVHGVIEAYANPLERQLGLAEVVFSLILCFSAGFYVYTAPKN